MTFQNSKRIVMVTGEESGKDEGCYSHKARLMPTDASAAVANQRCIFKPIWLRPADTEYG